MVRVGRAALVDVQGMRTNLENGYSTDSQLGLRLQYAHAGT